MSIRILSPVRKRPAFHRLAGGGRLALLGMALGLVPSSAPGQGFEAVGTRAAGMAGAFVAVADDATAAYWNPAGLATGPTVDLQWDLQFRETFGERDRPVAQGERASRGTSRLIGLGVPALGLCYYRLHTVSVAADSTTVAAEGGRETERWGMLPARTVTTQNFGINLLQSLADGLVVGTTVRVVRGAAARGSTSGGLPEEALDAASGLEGRARTTVDLDLGAMASFGVVRVGIVARNLRQPVFGTEAGWEGVRLRRQVRVGMAVVPRSRPAGRHGPFTLSVDADLTRRDGPTGEQRDVAAGVERWWAGGRVGARAGIRASTLGPRRPVAAAGVSVGVRSSTFVEGQVTRGPEASDRTWGISARVTF